MTIKVICLRINHLEINLKISSKSNGKLVLKFNLFFFILITNKMIAKFQNVLKHLNETKTNLFFF